MQEAKVVKVFQELYLRGPMIQRAKLREALVNASKSNSMWSHNVEKEQDLEKHAGEDADVLVFERSASDGFAAAGLVLWSSLDGYSLANIVPIKVSALSHSEYNTLLLDFASCIAEPAATQAGFSVEITKPMESLADWVSANTAEALQRFSKLANMSTGSAHPLDQRRWLDFVIKAHRDERRLDTDRLCRWLIEVERWPDEAAHSLVIEYEFGMALLTQYDQAV